MTTLNMKSSTTDRLMSSVPLVTALAAFGYAAAVDRRANTADQRGRYIGPGAAQWRVG
ncbi:hypothetical protein [Arthrobacter castelli]|uniref:hypothetical protein n=1 Tax=Arthrobacter castelli TaxID=271431 RepID=UPI00040ABFC0|nr:hypothetical protein [Arthrobacter castelli]